MSLRRGYIDNVRRTCSRGNAILLTCRPCLCIWWRVSENRKVESIGALSYLSYTFANIMYGEHDQCSLGIICKTVKISKNNIYLLSMGFNCITYRQISSKTWQICRFFLDCINVVAPELSTWLSIRWITSVYIFYRLFLLNYVFRSHCFNSVMNKPCCAKSPWIIMF